MMARLPGGIGAQTITLCRGVQFVESSIAPKGDKCDDVREDFVGANAETGMGHWQVE
jgi:hypothetical protein